MLTNKSFYPDWFEVILLLKIHLIFFFISFYNFPTTFYRIVINGGILTHERFNKVKIWITYLISFDFHYEY
jgi:hypothetical protein